MMTRDQYWTRWRREAQRQYAEHQLLGETYWDGARGARWLIGRPGSSVFLTEIVAGACGSLVTHGDGELARFAYATDPVWPRLCWMAARPPSDYTFEKYQIGMNLRLPEQCFNREVAASDMEEMIQDFLDEEDEGRQPLIDALREVRRRDLDECCTTSDVLRALSEETPEAHEAFYEWEPGHVPPTGMFFAHAALERAMLLLWGKYGLVGPPGAT